MRFVYGNEVWEAEPTGMARGVAGTYPVLLTELGVRFRCVSRPELATLRGSVSRLPPDCSALELRQSLEDAILEATGADSL